MAKKYPGSYKENKTNKSENGTKRKGNSDYKKKNHKNGDENYAGKNVRQNYSEKHMDENETIDENIKVGVNTTESSQIGTDFETDNENNRLGVIEGRNACMEAFKAGKTIDKLFVLTGCNDGPIQSILREARKRDTIINFVKKERLDQISETGKHQGVIAYAAAYTYAEVDDILKAAQEKNEDPFIIIADNIEDPHNLGSIIRTANLAGAHGVIISKRHAVGLTPTVAKASAGAINYTPVAKVTNISKTIEELKDKGIWFVCADMDGDKMYDLKLTGPIGVIVGNEGSGVSRLVKEKCEFVASIPMFGDIDSLNASVAMGVLSYEIVRQRLMK